MFAVNMLTHSSWKMLNIQYDKNKFTYFVCHYISVLYPRQFLCLGDPLMCSGENLLPVSCEEANCSSTVPPSPYRLPFWITSCFMKKKFFYHICCLKRLHRSSQFSVIYCTDQTKDSEEDNRKSSKKAIKRSFSLLKTPSDSGMTVPLHRIISLVSITSPRSFQPHKISISPSFVEFDMTDSGYG